MTEETKDAPAPETKQPQRMPRKGVFLDVQQAQQLVDYLKRHPYDQVAVLIASLLKAPEVSL